MANYFLNINTSNFKPFDMSLSLLVLKDYRDAYYRMEERLDKLAEDTESIQLPEDSKYNESLLDYRNRLNSLNEEFSKGMNYETNVAAKKLRNEYRNNIKPIKDMVESYNKHVDKIEAIKILDPTAIIGKTPSVDDFYGGKKVDLGYTSGKQVQTDAKLYFTGINNALTQKPEFVDFISKLYYLLTKYPGIDPTEALKVALSQFDPNGQYADDAENLFSHLQRFYDKQNTEGYTDQAKLQVWNREILGMMEAIKAPEYSTLTDHTHTGTKAIPSPKEPTPKYEMKTIIADKKLTDDALEKGLASGEYTVEELGGWASSPEYLQNTTIGSTLRNTYEDVTIYAVYKKNTSTPIAYLIRYDKNQNKSKAKVGFSSSDDGEGQKASTEPESSDSITYNNITYNPTDGNTYIPSDDTDPSYIKKDDNGNLIYYSSLDAKGVTIQN